MVKNLYASRRADQGYLSPSQREGCRSCADRSAAGLRLDRDFDAYECLLGGFIVSPGGICPHYRPRPATNLPEDPK